MSTGWSIELTLTQQSELVRVRAAVQHLVERTGLSSADAVLAANELATNALSYTSGPCRVRGRIGAAAGVLRIEVADPSTLALPSVVPAEPSALDGRGLSIVNQIVSRWGVELRGPLGKVVWFEIDPA